MVKRDLLPTNLASFPRIVYITIMQITQPQSSLPSPDLAQLQHCQKLSHVICQEITEQGAITFARFMELALYAPGLGYYSAGMQKFGKEGDFVTAPEISSLYSRCIAKQCDQILRHLTNGIILEFGAGTGEMAAEILLQLEAYNNLPERYFILEVSADLQQRQKELLASRIPHLSSRVEWLRELPSRPLDGIILANEVLDAFPIHRFKQTSTGIKEFFVDLTQGDFCFKLAEPNRQLLNEIQGFDLDFPLNYESECNLYIAGWLKSVSKIIKSGAVLIMDYGFPRHEYYHPDRDMGTLMCHYRHHAHDNPLFMPGLQDITAHVDFTTVALEGTKLGFSVAGFANQASFLLSCGIVDFITDNCTFEERLNYANQIKILTLPTEMGELFKVMALTKKLSLPLLGFEIRDMREKL